MLTRNEALRLLSYDPETGVFRWNRRPLTFFKNESRAKAWHSNFAGKIAGSPDPVGYRRINIMGKFYLAHRVAWLMIYGEWPQFIDHINGDPTDNRIVNLRSGTRGQNSRNLKLFRTNTSGHPGISWNGQAWHAYIGVNGNRKNIGRFQSLPDALAARKSAEEELGYHENHGRCVNPAVEGGHAR